MAKANCIMLPFIQNKPAILFGVVVLFALISCIDKNAAKTNTAVDDSVQQSKVVQLPDDSDTRHLNKKIMSDEDWLLIPGIAAGQTKIGEDADSIYKRLGKPDGGDAAMMKAVAVWYNHHDTTNNSIAIYTQRGTDSGDVARVLQIRITSPSFKTKEGIGPSSLLSQIQTAFDVKKTEEYSDAGNKYTVYDSEQGIAFEIDAKQNQCVAIVIHKAGTIGKGTYLKFRTTNKYFNRG